MPRQAAELAIAHQARDAQSIPGLVDTRARISQLEREIDRSRDQSIDTRLKEVIDRVCSFTCADGAAIALRDAMGVVCRASVGNAPEVGSRLQPESALTRECFETGGVVVCEDAETDFRVRRAAATSLRMRSAVVVPIHRLPPSPGVVEVLGLIEVLSSRPFSFDTDHVDGLKRIAELLAPALSPAPPQTSEMLVPVPVALPVPAEEPRPQRRVTNAVLLLLFLLLVSASILFIKARTYRPFVSAPALTSGRPAQPVSRPPNTPSLSGEEPRLKSEAASRSQFSPPASASPVVSSAAAPADKPVAIPAEKPAQPQLPAIENQTALAPQPSLPAVVLHGLPPGTQVFVDDQLIASANPSTETSIPMLSAGQHRLRLRFNGYRDFDREFKVEPGQTSGITPTLEPFDLPPLSQPAKDPILEATSAVLPITPSPSLLPRRDFVLDRTLKAHSGWVTGVAFSPDGGRLASASWDRTLKFWQVSNGQQLGAVPGKLKEIQSLAFSRDGRWLATENSYNTVTLLQPSTGEEVLALPSGKPTGALGSNWAYSIAFSPDGQWLAAALDDRTVRLWDVKTGLKLRDLTGLRRPVIYIAVSADGRMLATGHDSRTIAVWDASQGQELFELGGHKKTINAVAFSPNGKFLASASADMTLKLWDLKTGRELRTFTGHENAVSSLAFSPDGRWLVSASWDKTVKIWDVEAGREVQTLAGHSHPVYSVAFDSKGQWVASGSEDGTIKLWRLTEIADRGKLRH